MLRDRGGLWQIDLPNPGGWPKRIRVSTGIPVAEGRRRAEVAHAQALCDIAAGKYRDAAAGRYTLREAFSDCTETHWRGVKDWRGIEGNYRVVESHFGPTRDLGTISTDAMGEFVRAQRAAGLSGATINRRLAVVSRLLHHAHERGKLAAVPKVPKQREATGRKRILSPAEEGAIIAALRERGKHTMASLVVFLVETGARLGEALSLRSADLLPDSARFVDTKSGRDRVVPLTRRAQEGMRIMFACPSLGDRVFTGITQDSAHRDWTQAKADAGTPDASAAVIHSLRHTCATRLLEAGVEVAVVQKWLGHAHVQTTMRYAKVRDGMLTSAARMLDTVTRNVPFTGPEPRPDEAGWKAKYLMLLASLAPRPGLEPGTCGLTVRSPSSVAVGCSPDVTPGVPDTTSHPPPKVGDNC